MIERVDVGARSRGRVHPLAFQCEANDRLARAMSAVEVTSGTARAWRHVGYCPNYDIETPSNVGTQSREPFQTRFNPSHGS